MQEYVVGMLSDRECYWLGLGQVQETLEINWLTYKTIKRLIYPRISFRFLGLNWESMGVSKTENKRQLSDREHSWSTKWDSRDF